METYETLKVTNNGNANAYYKWSKPVESLNIFFIEPEEGFVPSKSTSEFKIIYRPNQNSAGKQEEEKMILRVNLLLDQRWSGHVHQIVRSSERLQM